jgi:outer membrane murein-binding lipoprotein Lpp
MKMTKAKGLLLVISALTLSGCACVSKEYVDQQDAMLADRMGKLESKVAADEAKLNDVGSKVDSMAADVVAAKADAADAKATAADASKKADEAQACCAANAEKIKKAFELRQKK